MAGGAGEADSTESATDVAHRTSGTCAGGGGRCRPHVRKVRSFRCTLMLSLIYCHIPVRDAVAFP